jgi:PadR family transcriptional regulator, regulatory protein PadR
MYGSELRGLLSPVLLLLIRERPAHGYDLTERLADLGVGGVESGHVYRVLRSLERDGMVSSAWTASGSGPARRRYALTAGGAAHLDTLMGRLTELDEVLGTCLRRWRDTQLISQDERGNGQRERAGGRTVMR